MPRKPPQRKDTSAETNEKTNPDQTPRPDARSAWDKVVGQFAGLPEPDPPPDRPLRHRQQEAIIAFYRAKAKGIERQLIVLPTGGGKTILARDLIARHKRAIFHVPRRELLKQTIKTMEAAFGKEKVGSISDSTHDIKEEHRVIIAMVPTAYERLRFSEGHEKHIPRTGFDLVIFDECHHATARTWRAVAEHYQEGTRLGLTGTPERSDGAPLSDIFDEIVYELSIVDAVKEGLLVPPDARVIRTTVDISNVQRKGNDLDLKELANTIDTPARNKLIVEKYKELGYDPGRYGGGGEQRRFIAFCASVDHAIHLAQELSEAGFPTAAIWGEDSERESKLEKHASGELLGLTNVHTLTEGYDDPSVSCVIMARPMRSRNTYTQALGRGLRLFTGKRDCLVIDVVDNAGKHDLAAAWKFFGDPTAIQDERGRKRSKVADEQAFDLYEALGGQLPLASFVQRATLLRLPPDIRPTPYGERQWHREKASTAQLELLSKAGYDISKTSWTAGQAKVIIENFPPSAKQAILLVAYGFDVFFVPWNRLQADVALEQVRQEGKKPNWGLLKELIPNYKKLMQE